MQTGSVKFHIPCFSSMEQNGGDSIIKSNIHTKRPPAKSLLIIFKDVFAKIKTRFRDLSIDLFGFGFYNFSTEVQGDTRTGH